MYREAHRLHWDAPKYPLNVEDALVVAPPRSDTEHFAFLPLKRFVFLVDFFFEQVGLDHAPRGLQYPFVAGG
jgi:hypothetical protein